MKNYFSKFAIEESKQSEFKLNTDLFRAFSTRLTIFLYVIMFLICSIFINDFIIDLIVKVVILVVGFGLYMYGQYKYSEKLSLAGKKVRVSKDNLIKATKYYGPHFVVLTAFLAVVISRERIGFPIVYINLAILLFGIVYSLIKLKKNETI